MSTVPAVTTGPYREPAEVLAPPPPPWVPNEIHRALQHRADLLQYVRRFYGLNDGLPTEQNDADVKALLAVRAVMALESIAASLATLASERATSKDPT